MREYKPSSDERRGDERQAILDTRFVSKELNQSIKNRTNVKKTITSRVRRM